MGYEAKRDRILVINPGSTSTKIAVYQDGQAIFEENLSHPADQLKHFDSVADQYDFRKGAIFAALEANGISLAKIQCVSARGGLLKPLPQGGTYLVNEAMCRELRKTKQEHASNLGALLAKGISDEQEIPAFIVDPVVVDEMRPIAKLTGLKECERKAIWHALNQKAIARRAALELGKEYGNLRCIVAHMGGGISVGAHKNGITVDVNNGLNGDGPFSPERAGSIPNHALLNFVNERGYTAQQVEKTLVGNGGLVNHLGTNDAREVERMIHEGNEKAKLVYEGMAYQVAKEIGAMASVLKGRVDVIALTGGLAHSGMLTGWIQERIEFIAPVRIYPGEGEMEALYQGAKRVMDEVEEARAWETPGWPGL